LGTSVTAQKQRRREKRAYIRSNRAVVTKDRGRKKKRGPKKLAAICIDAGQQV